MLAIHAEINIAFILSELNLTQSKQLCFCIYRVEGQLIFPLYPLFLKVLTWILLFVVFILGFLYLKY